MFHDHTKTELRKDTCYLLTVNWPSGNEYAVTVMTLAFHNIYFHSISLISDLLLHMSGSVIVKFGNHKTYIVTQTSGLENCPTNGLLVEMNQVLSILPFIFH